MRLNNIHKPNPPVRIGISSCLLGQNVRYDGGNTENTYVTEELARQFEFVPYCPEVAIGMGIPRPPIQLVDCDGEIHALGIDNPAMDLSLPLSEYGKHVASEIHDLSGFIFKRNSPSCGINDVKVLTANNHYELRGQGIFAQQIIQHLPSLPVIDEQQLMHKTLRQNFLENVKIYFQATPP